MLRLSALHPYAALAATCCMWGTSLAQDRQPDRGAAGGGGDRPAAVLEGLAIGWPEVAPLLAEAAGSGVLEEIVLDRALRQACADRSITVGTEQLRFERDLLSSSLARAARVPPTEGERLIDEVRVSRGLGEKRFAALLARNAMLRAIARAEAGPAGVPVSEQDVQQAFELRYGPKVRARMILVRTQNLAAEVGARIGAGESFGDIAAALSEDPSRLRGGMLDPISPADPGYPVAFRRSLSETEPGKVSVPVMVEWDSQPGFAIVRVEERIVGTSIDRASVESELTEEVRAVRERAIMDRLARSMIDEQAAKLSVLDSSLEWSWRNRRGPSR